MPIVRASLADTDPAAMAADLALAAERTDAEVAADAAEDGGSLTAAQLRSAVAVYPRLTPAGIRRLREQLGLSQSQFALRFGFGLDTLQQYEQGRRAPSGPASTLLRVIAAEPDAVARALAPVRQRTLT